MISPRLLDFPATAPPAEDTHENLSQDDSGAAIGGVWGGGKNALSELLFHNLRTDGKEKKE